MSPSNRQNPDFSRSDGRFGWDVVAGYYVVMAERDGCVSAADPSKAEAVSRVMTIPPPVTDLDLRLDCTDRTGTPPPTPPAGGGPVIVRPIANPSVRPRKLASIKSAKLVKGKVLAVKVACAKSAKTACSGKLSAKLGKKAVGSKSFKKLKPGKSATVRIALNKKGRALVKKAKKGKKIKFALRSTIKDAAGKGATVKRTVSVRR